MKKKSNKRKPKSGKSVGSRKRKGREEEGGREKKRKQSLGIGKATCTICVYF